MPILFLLPYPKVLVMGGASRLGLAVGPGVLSAASALASSRFIAWRLSTPRVSPLLAFEVLAYYLLLPLVLSLLEPSRPSRPTSKAQLRGEQGAGSGRWRRLLASVRANPALQAAAESVPVSLRTYLAPNLHLFLETRRQVAGHCRPLYLPPGLELPEDLAANARGAAASALAGRGLGEGLGLFCDVAGGCLLLRVEGPPDRGLLAAAAVLEQMRLEDLMGDTALAERLAKMSDPGANPSPAGPTPVESHQPLALAAGARPLDVDLLLRSSDQIQPVHPSQSGTGDSGPRVAMTSFRYPDPGPGPGPSCSCSQRIARVTLVGSRRPGQVARLFLGPSRPGSQQLLASMDASRPARLPVLPAEVAEELGRAAHPWLAALLADDLGFLFECCQGRTGGRNRLLRLLDWIHSAS